MDSNSSDDCIGPYHIVETLKPEKGVYFGIGGGEKVILKQQPHPYSDEIDALTAVDHPNIVNLRDVISHEKSYFAVLDYIPGRTVYECAFEEKSALNIIAQAAQGLAHLHDKGYVHGDIAATNILVSGEWKRGKAYIIDFESSASIMVDCANHIHSTVCYRCLDQLLYQVLPSNDVYGLGAVAYVMLAGRPPQMHYEHYHVWNVVEEPYKSKFEAFCLLQPPPKLVIQDSAAAEIIMSMVEPLAKNRPSMETVASLLREYHTQSP
jgi:serine/threonine protein kinase